MHSRHQFEARYHRFIFSYVCVLLVQCPRLTLKSTLCLWRYSCKPGVISAASSQSLRASLFCVCVWYCTRVWLCVVLGWFVSVCVALVRFTTGKRLHSMHTHSQLHSTTLEKHAKTTQMTTPAKLTHSLHKGPCGPVTEIYSDTPVLIGGEIEHLLPVPQ